ncbi:hypothetical protein CP49_17990 [Bradyrhizobium valentinum]|uniref:Uncharacterized protein n=2 Tax=Bradyrhizobium valentinum TaxID=1518501 RepID=A0A0R3M373_9BRAD|nr:hypothetical protein CP49_17990 [Bradyrhizobium valentinum]
MVVKTMKRYGVFWLRASKTFVVRNVEGVDVATDVERLTEAWEIAEALEREHAQRVAARKAAQAEAARVRALRQRSALVRA